MRRLKNKQSLFADIHGQWEENAALWVYTWQHSVQVYSTQQNCRNIRKSTVKCSQCLYQPFICNVKRTSILWAPGKEIKAKHAEISTQNSSKYNDLFSGQENGNRSQLQTGDLTGFINSLLNRKQCNPAALHSHSVTKKLSYTRHYMNTSAASFPIVLK